MDKPTVVIHQESFCPNADQIQGLFSITDMMYPVSIPQIATILILGASLLATEFSTVGAQIIDPDLIDFSQLPGFSDLRQCVRDCFGGCSGCSLGNPQVAKTVGCATNKCLCSTPSTFELSLISLIPCVKPCATVDDTEIAKKLLLDYCAKYKYYYTIGPDDTLTSPVGEDPGDSTVAVPTPGAPPAGPSIADGPGTSPKVLSNTGTGKSAKYTGHPGGSDSGPNIPSARYELIIFWATIALGLPLILTRAWI